MGAVDEHVEHQPGGDRDGGEYSHAVECRSNERSIPHHLMPAPASALAVPIAAIHGVASVKIAAATTNMTP